MNGRPYLDFIPPGSFQRIEGLIAKPMSQWPWPYSVEAFVSVACALPEFGADDTLIRLVRQYLGQTWARKASSTGNSNEKREAIIVWQACKAAFEALDKLSPEAESLLSRLNRFPGDQNMMAFAVKMALDRFMHAHPTLQYLTEEAGRERRGRPTDAIDHLFAAQLRLLYDRANGRRHARGFKQWRELVVEPLGIYGVRQRSQKGWDDIEANRKVGGKAKSP